jgi:primosomal protein N' (replication factor Y) (superfamily II helicase)
MILAIAIDAPLRRTFDYRVPSGVVPETILAGARVWVPFGRRRVVGVVLERREQSDVPASKLKAVYDVIDSEPALDGPLLQLLGWSADYYRHPLGEVIAAALPTALREGAPLKEEQWRWRLTSLGREQGLERVRPSARRQRALVEYLLAREVVAMKELLSATDSNSDALRRLAELGFVEQVSAPEAPELSTSQARGELALNDAQRAALDRVCGTLGAFASHLLYGVTGSGKTEVYLQTIARVLARGEQALVMVPEIGLTPQLLSRFRDRFAAPIAVMHSGLNDSERLAAWRAAREGVARIVIGTRSAVFAPLAQPGLLIVDEEHDASFKQQEGFRYSARDLAIVRAQRLNIPIVLGSATPSLESLSRAQRQPEWLSKLPQRAAHARQPRWSLIDLRKNAQTQGIATPVLLSMHKHLDAGGQIMLFLNRRGYAPVLFCPSCGWSAHCKRCDAHLTVHGRAGALICHHCGAQHSAIATCPSCFAPAKPVGQGTERIEEAIAELFPNIRTARLDRDSTRRKGDLESLLGEVNRGEVRILIGTQMLTKGHDFPNVTLVVVLNADQGLFSTDFRASERLAQTIVQVAGRAGRAERPGEVLIQTEYPDHPLLTLLLNGGYDAFAAGALSEREQCQWPPFARIALVRAEATAMHAPMEFLNTALNIGRKQNARGVKLLGPAPAMMERRAGRHRAQLLVHALSHSPLQRFLHAWIPQLESLPISKRVRWSIDVDVAELS